MLLRHPHDVDIRNNRGETLLLCAVQAGNEEAVDQLLQAGADPSASTTAGPEGEARRQLELEIYENNRIPLQSRGRIAAQKGQINLVKLLHNADPIQY